MPRRRALAFAGTIRHLATAPVEPVLVVDIGGGSTELILGDTEPRAAHSMDIGSVRLHERHLHDDPPAEAQVAACVTDIDAALDSCPVDPAAAATVVGIGGTVTTVAAGVLDLPAYDRDAIDQQVLTVDDVHATVDRIVAMPVTGRLEMPYLHPGRADVIDAGALILSRVLRRVRTRHDRDLRGRHPRRHRLVARVGDPLRPGLPSGSGIPERHDRSGYHTASEQPLGAIVHRLSEQLPELVRSELRLAQAELTEKGKAAGLGVGLFSAAGILGLFASARSSPPASSPSTSPCRRGRPR